MKATCIYRDNGQSVVRELPTMKEPTSHPFEDFTGDRQMADKNIDEWDRYNKHVASLREYPASFVTKAMDGKDVECRLQCDYEYCGVFDHPDCLKGNCKNLYVVPVVEVDTFIGGTDHTVVYEHPVEQGEKVVYPATDDYIGVLKENYEAAKRNQNNLVRKLFMETYEDLISIWEAKAAGKFVMSPAHVHPPVSVEALIVDVLTKKVWFRSECDESMLVAFPKRYIECTMSAAALSSCGQYTVELLNDQPWPLNEVLGKLIEAAEILLHRKNYDGPDHEEIFLSVKRAKEYQLFLNNKTEVK